MELEASWLLEQLKAEQARTSERMHRDARRVHTLKQATLMLGTGMSADSVRDWLAGQHLPLPARKRTAAYDGYGRGA